ncbi:MAG: phosphoenolpyruvate carboxykinase (ATP), partial [Geminicoccaceae bacterium]
MSKAGPAVSQHGLEIHGLANLARENWNFPATVLVQAALERGEGCLAVCCYFLVYTVIYTGWSPSDKFIVDDP